MPKIEPIIKEKLPALEPIEAADESRREESAVIEDIISNLTYFHVAIIPIATVGGYESNQYVGENVRELIKKYFFIYPYNKYKNSGKVTLLYNLFDQLLKHNISNANCTLFNNCIILKKQIANNYSLISPSKLRIFSRNEVDQILDKNGPYAGLFNNLLDSSGQGESSIQSPIAASADSASSHLEMPPLRDVSTSASSVLTPEQLNFLNSSLQKSSVEVGKEISLLERIVLTLSHAHDQIAQEFHTFKKDSEETHKRLREEIAHLKDELSKVKEADLQKRPRTEGTHVLPSNMPHLPPISSILEEVRGEASHSMAQMLSNSLVHVMSSPTDEQETENVTQNTIQNNTGSEF